MLSINSLGRKVKEICNGCRNPGNLKPGQAETLAISYCVLAKSLEDLEKIQNAFATRS